MIMTGFSFVVSSIIILPLLSRGAGTVGAVADER